jgi:F-type H+-transporting ATPase subunit delta
MSIVLSKVAEPYAEALLDLAKSNDSLKETTKDINLISKFFSNSSDLKKFLKNPFFTRDAKKNVVKNIFSEEIGINTLNFLFLLVDRNRIQVFESISQKYLELSYKQESIEIAKLTSCIPLSADQQKEIAKQLKFITGAKQIKFALKIDQRLLGGFTIEFGSTMIDMSIRGQLKELSAHLGVPEAFAQMESGIDIKELAAMAREEYYQPT